MRRYLLTILVFTMLMPLGASAQWYLFPGGRPAKDSTAVKNSDNAFVPLSEDKKDVVSPLEEAMEENEILRSVKVSLILPLKSTGTPNSNFLDFYSGVLMAADALSTESRPVELSVFDSTVGMPGIADLESSDLIIGPVSYDDIQRILPRARGKFIISPLDPKVAQLTDTHNVIQAPAGWEAQVDELVRWIAADKRGGDIVVLLQSVNEGEGETTARMAKRMSEEGIPYEVSSTPSAYEGKVRGTCRFVISSEDDEFCCSAVREIALMNIRGTHNAVYTTSRIRSLNDLEVESLHAASAHVCATYYADPADQAVKVFNKQYKSLFKGDPGQWVYQGYDLMNYFGSMLEKDPDFSPEVLSTTPWKGLQTDFRFDESGKTNTAVRRLIYNTNNSISVVR
ncbi:MAG: ABC transporter substrate-binding protein [Bacteroidales bacterium]|nr:ABC transporter substrate-binding protein [Bacteroidales bacterium]